MAIQGNLLGAIVVVLSTCLPFVATDSTALTSCLSSANLQPISFTSTNYTADSLAYNRRLSYNPVDIVFPKNDQDVASAVDCASQAGIKVAARSGGHSYAANGIGGENGSLVIDLRNLNGINVTASNQTAVFGTGIRIGDLALALFNGGNQAISHGVSLRAVVTSERTMLTSLRPFPYRNLPLRWHWRTSRMRRLWTAVETMGSCA